MNVTKEGFRLLVLTAYWSLGQRVSKGVVEYYELLSSVAALPVHKYVDSRDETANLNGFV